MVGAAQIALSASGGVGERGSAPHKTRLPGAIHAEQPSPPELLNPNASNAPGVGSGRSAMQTKISAMPAQQSAQKVRCKPRPPSVPPARPPRQGTV